ncbi:MAG: hydrogenase maturation protease [Candidatus Aenigmatarchaeota archaeon]
MKTVMSIGNPIKCDDNIGNIVLDKLDVEGIKKIKGETTPENFIDQLKICEELVIIDALQFDGEVGEVRTFELNDIKNVVISTHNITFDLLQKFLPNSKIKIIGIQTKSIDFGIEMSEELKSKMGKIVENVNQLLKQ